ncbi:SUR7/PalI family-domain-containing protein [Penicillium herquei]|nr:SUR7/PalI family-domain-containing protein [Penicillium herquei]
MPQRAQLVLRSLSGLLMIGSWICILLVGIGCTRVHSAKDLYLYHLDLQNLTTNPHSVLDTTLNQFNTTRLDNMIQALNNVKDSNDLNETYSIGLWSYCTKNATSNDTWCSKPKGGFWFNPIDIWGLNNTNTNLTVPEKLQKTLATYHTASLWMDILYIIAFAVATLDIITKLLTFRCSRLGSCFSTLVTTVSLLVITAVAISLTAVFSTLNTAVKIVLHPYGITGHLGRHSYAAIWLAVVLSLSATLLSLFYCCCCSQRRDTDPSVSGYPQHANGYSPVPMKTFAQSQNISYPPQ